MTRSRSFRPNFNLEPIIIFPTDMLHFTNKSTPFYFEISLTRCTSTWRMLPHLCHVIFLPFLSRERTDVYVSNLGGWDSPDKSGATRYRGSSSSSIHLDHHCDTYIKRLFSQVGTCYVTLSSRGVTAKFWVTLGPWCCMEERILSDSGFWKGESQRTWTALPSPRWPLIHDLTRNPMTTV